jgi:hypothetical protein
LSFVIIIARSLFPFDNFTVQGSAIGSDTLIDIEFLKFDDVLIAVDNSAVCLRDIASN